MPNKPEFRFPNTSERAAIIGQTGSGKTRLGTWLLSHAPYTSMPYIVVNFKRETLFEGIDRIKEIGFKDTPSKPGLYQISPRPDQEKELEDWLYRIWEHEKTGLFFDETLQIPGHNRNGAFKAILTQVLSKRIPCIMCNQRPAGISTSVFSEADFFACFRLSRFADIQRLYESGIPDAIDLSRPLPPYHSRWYDVKEDNLVNLSPVEPDEDILARFNRRLRPKSRWF